MQGLLQGGLQQRQLCVHLLSQALDFVALRLSGRCFERLAIVGKIFGTQMAGGGFGAVRAGLQRGQIVRSQCLRQGGQGLGQAVQSQVNKAQQIGRVGAYVLLEQGQIDAADPCCRRGDCCGVGAGKIGRLRPQWHFL